MKKNRTITYGKGKEYPKVSWEYELTREDIFIWKALDSECLTTINAAIKLLGHLEATNPAG